MRAYLIIITFAMISVLQFAENDINTVPVGLQNDSKVTARLSDFPTLHPVIVHFAIVLIIISAAMQVVNIFLLKNDLAWIIGILLSIGLFAAFIASENFHPHTTGLSEHSRLVLKQHDHWAEWTIYSASAGLIAQILYLYFERFGNSLLNRYGRNIPSPNLNRGSVILIALLMLISASCVAIAGHYGAQLVHIEGVGPQGKFLEMNHDD